MSLQRVFLTFGAMMFAACAPTKVTDPPADHPASQQAETRELPVLTKLEAPAFAASQPSSQPASQPSTQPASQPSEQPMDHSKHEMPREKAPPKKQPAKKPAKKAEPPPPKKTEPDHSGHDMHQHQEGGDQ